MKRVAIIGGGISGLSAAYYLEKQRQSGADLEYVIFERAPKLGGVLRTDRVEGCLVEAGPDSFLTEKPWALLLCRELGLGDQIIGSNDADRKTYILVKGRLIEMPDGLMFMVPTKILPTLFSPLFSITTKLHMAEEFFHKPKLLNHDEPVASMVERHFGTEMVDRLADPLLAGVYGGDARDLSVRAVLPRFAEMEVRHGSLSRGMLASRRKRAQMMKGRPKPPLFSSLKDGMQQMVDALLDRIPAGALRSNCGVGSVRYTGQQWQVFHSGSTTNFDAVVLATPASAASKLLQAGHPELAAELSGIAYSSSVTVTLIYTRADASKLPPGFGFLVPRSEKQRMLACTFVHNKFPHRAPADRAIIRAFLGGTRDEAVLGLSEEEILRTVLDELRQILDLRAVPLATRVYKWPRAMAQYSPGHLERVARIERLRDALPGLALAGNAFRGIGVPDCVRSGMEAAERVGTAAAVPSTKS
ncbi:MAG: protoporphyrinogen oxidase [Terriglobales bacterium]